MTSSKRSKLPCATCGKAIGIFTCRRCKKDFCSRHSIEHRQTLGKQMDGIIVDHHQLQQNLVDERQSMSTIRQVAEEARKLVVNNLNKHKNKITENIAHLTRQLNKACQDDDFDEIDLKEWLQKLNQLKSDLALSDMINIRHSHDTLITRLVVSITPTEVFGQVAGPIHIEDNGQIIAHGQPGTHGTARSVKESIQ
ncbi:unnamed protein product [Rotaria sordida]|uniref:Uncharacterized protein n=1 Tax=Rotaria sordida TaxID=392033 RepID=A0A818WRX9_9BILA|nr:unnamed protein product [Rotaria sordida]